jgi:hypothetical protein
MKCIGKRRCFYILCIYVFAIVFWLFLVLLLGIYRRTASLVLWLAPISFLISMYNVRAINEEVEERIFRTSFFGTGLVISITLIAWIRDLVKIDVDLVIVLFVAFLFTLLGHLDLWLPVKWNLVYNHVRTVFQVFSIVLFCYFVLVLLETGAEKLINKP